MLLLLVKDGQIGDVLLARLLLGQTSTYPFRRARYFPLNIPLSLLLLLLENLRSGLLRRRSQYLLFRQ